MDMSQYRELFLSETREHINNLNQLVVTLEQEPGNRETIDALFREAHSIKGMAATMGFDRTARLSHHLEDLLDDFRSSGQIPSAAIDYLLSGIDILDGLIDDLQSNQPEREIETFLRETPEPQPIMVAEESEPETLVTDAEAPGEAEDETASEEEPIPEEPDAYQVLVDLAEDTPAAAARGLLILS